MARGAVAKGMRVACRDKGYAEPAAKRISADLRFCGDLLKGAYMGRKLKKVAWELVADGETALTLWGRRNEQIETVDGLMDYEAWCKAWALRVCKTPGRVARVIYRDEGNTRMCCVTGNFFIPVESECLPSDI